MGLAIAFNLLGACTDMCHPFVVHDISVKKAGEREINHVISMGQGSLELETTQSGQRFVEATMFGIISSDPIGVEVIWSHTIYMSLTPYSCL
jgi:hypothetical protein